MAAFAETVSSQTAAAERSREPLAIICGSGPLPFAVADAARRQGRDVFLIALSGWTKPASLERYPHAWVNLGQFGRVWRLAHQAGCRDILCIGGIVRPSIRSLRLDWQTVRLLPRIYRLFRGGDDHLLSGLGRIFEEQGFRAVAAQDIAPDILVPAGILSRRQPTAAEEDDIAYGFAVLDAIGPFDVGQAVVVFERRVLAVEAAEGTDQMLARVAQLRTNGRINLPAGRGVLVKAPKPQQDRRYDLPSIGPTTVEMAQAAGLAGIAVRAGGVIAVDPIAMTAAADRDGLFVVSMDAAAAASP